MKTNEEAKIEEIKKAYLDLGFSIEEIIKLEVDEKGAVRNSLYLPKEYRVFFYFNMELNLTPISLAKLENNNGWIRIKPDGTNLPTDDSVKYRVLIIKGTSKIPSISEYPYLLEYVISDFNAGFISHYKIIEKELLPIY